MAQTFHTLRFLHFLSLLQAITCYVVSLSSGVPSSLTREYDTYSDIRLTQYHQGLLSSSRIYPKYSSRLQVTVSPDDFHYLQSWAHSFQDMIVTTTTQAQPMDASVYNSHDTFINTVSTLIADATAVAADATTSTEIVAPTEPSWWDNYIDFISSSISFVHSAIDQPLRNLGFDQTWGLAIFLFTAGK